MREVRPRTIPLLYTQHLRLSDAKSSCSMLVMTLAAPLVSILLAAFVIAEKRKIASCAELR